ncbi:AP-2 adaptor complex sigma subunit Aps2 [Schizosaccharomyces pombe]|uniref:AP-2 complex subunit sigma n=1 Tax=Schizosaccharomyces pombe (strain 972 / ATCC 24843) TaxID=284812 RepID=AP2S_SCHPO|nr:putative AP-2 adaptor complex subunit Aps2 [Schizosaccharomyces pombe]Q9Y7L6.1 RecName: Full=AP-2 complex subunit sigma; AltName: Full=Adaptin small chain; AltName: Full=Clathrin assembly protein 2 sigma small chain; AltName: Full=Sigma2-adaptin [Schizosaccharomyces pombe 972h-]CAB39361.1 AP-2 adaptor complex subunit Aps2 (predicted) [Schizosaccharomyces pombe]|eukprot:NP_596138.1 putative AP-2 adaptor complex subunit Aps2 [Schizosaccharomyces pombe]
MIQFILIQNRHGKNRLSKYYVPFDDDEKVRLKARIHQLISQRNQKFQANFLEWENSKLVYRRYAGLYFCFCVDSTDNDLAILEMIHFFVEILDSFFGNVCELDLIFNFYKVSAILDEIILGGEIGESNKKSVLERIEALEKLE